MYPCDGNHRVEVIPPYAGQAEVRFENIPSMQCSRNDEIRERDLLSCRDALYQTAFEGYIEDSSRLETLYGVKQVSNLRRARRIIIGVGMDKAFVVPESFLVRGGHGLSRLPFPEHGFPAISCLFDWSIRVRR